jgi:phage FluMu protein Com
MVIDGGFFRCEWCGKLLAERITAGTIIVCSRCKTRNELAEEEKDGRVILCTDSGGDGEDHQHQGASQGY